MSSFQNWLDRVNRHWGGVGSVITSTLCLAALAWALLTILGDYW